METRRYRTIVRGRFRDLDEERQTALVADAAGHDALKAAFTGEGTLTYDRTLKFFAFRYEFDVTGENAADCDLEAELVAEDRAIGDLAAREITHGPLTVSWTCMSEMRTERRKAPKRPKAAAS